MVVPPLALVIGCLVVIFVVVVVISLSHGFATISPLWWGCCFGLGWFSKINRIKWFCLVFPEAVDINISGGEYLFPR